ncbi:MAG: hypothetical protein ACI8QD_000600 [Cyclobacteriaceae bacterium]|jgi:hypothetical protein
MCDIQICSVCDRELGTTNISKHHLIPKSKGGRNSELIIIHNICHQKIHSVFSEKELQENYHSVLEIKGHDEMKKFLKWISKKDPGFYQRNKRLKK